MGKQAIPTFEELYGDVPKGPGTPQKQVAVDSYNQHKTKLGKISSIDSLAAVSLQVRQTLTRWRDDLGINAPFLVEVLSADKEPKRQYVGLLFPDIQVPWEEMQPVDKGRTKPYITPGDGSYLLTLPLTAVSELARLVQSLQPAVTQELLAQQLDAS